MSSKNWSQMLQRETLALSLVSLGLMNILTGILTLSPPCFISLSLFLYSLDWRSISCILLKQISLICTVIYIHSLPSSYASRYSSHFNSLPLSSKGKTLKQWQIKLIFISLFLCNFSYSKSLYDFFKNCTEKK